ncbi:MAG: DUF3592 domain-containing protein [Halioglobus sp.]
MPPLVKPIPGITQVTMYYEKIVEAMGLPFTLIYCAMLLGCFYFMLVSLPRSLSTKSWPKTYGEITKSSLKKGTRISNGSTFDVFSSDVAYRYVVDGNEYFSNRIKWLDHRSNNEAFHKQVIEKYSLGKMVNVFYDPKKPENGLLEPGLSTGNFIALLFFLFGLGSMTFLLSAKL